MVKTIEKDGRTITVQEYAVKWKVTTPRDKITLSYDIDKRNYPTFEDLKAYVLKEPMF